ncbi:MAG: TetR/AcrR family transcriptional regulator [Sneathiella sp.]|nr:TetR/AcrR family transcriptional regulator [Sneathiella sp.]
MTEKPNHKHKLVQNAIRLFRRKGYAGTGLNEILKNSGAPKGSLYYYFPEGKEQLGAQAVKVAAKTVLKTLEELEAKSNNGADFIKQYCEMLAYWISASGYKDGCPITTTLLEMSAASKKIEKAGRDGFSQWRTVFIRVLQKDGLTEEDAKEMSLVLLSTIQGAILLTRVSRNTEALRAVGKHGYMRFEKTAAL